MNSVVRRGVGAAVAARRCFSSGGMDFFKADSGKLAVGVYHKINTATLFVTPIAFMLPTGYTMPVDLALGVLFPIHSHIGLNYVVTDYLPKILPTSIFPAVRMGVAGLTGVMMLGLLRLNIGGPGITQTLKSLWKKPEEK
eukprot:CAMPEP_0118853792 /NCGR_PEP_ID=MMETSP1163-20130328/2250_1 /TAXON_ID=124430 /ORGANISM="Phaeomonas parva, Strain CCMP2877" /LENGTH=139 /DNA_ID=CAMNT_0006786405 /DNA_START=88 /DNA_END=507 /DNA_ORIENTATION=+